MVTRRQNIVLVTTLVTAMAASTFQYFALAVLSSDIIDEFDISRAHIGFLAAMNTGAGALLATRIGKLTDRLGGRLAAVAVLTVSGIGLLGTAAATSYWALLAASFVAGAPQAGGNPATNRLIGEHIVPGRRGLVTGWKQSGVQLGAFIAGLTLPGASNLFGWREAFLVYAIMMLGLAVIAFVGLPADLTAEPRSAATRREAASHGRLPDIIRRLAVYGFLLGVFGGGVSRFLPLFAEEELGYSETVAGLVAALSGLMGIAARIVWGVQIERGRDPRRGLVVIALGAAVTALMLVAATFSPPIVFLCAVMIAFSSSAWNVVGMLAIINDTPGRDTGRATGMVMLGFLGGLTVGAPLMGWVVDVTESYVIGWSMLGAFALAATLAPGALRSSRSSTRSTAMAG